MCYVKYIRFKDDDRHNCNNFWSGLLRNMRCSAVPDEGETALGFLTEFTKRFTSLFLSK